MSGIDVRNKAHGFVIAAQEPGSATHTMRCLNDRAIQFDGEVGDLVIAIAAAVLKNLGRDLLESLLHDSGYVQRLVATSGNVKKHKNEAGVGEHEVVEVPADPGCAVHCRDRAVGQSGQCGRCRTAHFPYRRNSSERQLHSGAPRKYHISGCILPQSAHGFYGPIRLTSPAYAPPCAVRPSPLWDPCGSSGVYTCLRFHPSWPGAKSGAAGVSA